MSAMPESSRARIAAATENNVVKTPNATILARCLLFAALACLLAVALWPEPVCRACGSDILRERTLTGIWR